MNSNLELIIGPMFSGKSTEIIKRVRLLKIINKKILIIKPKIDNRYIEGKITSHNFETIDCRIIDNLNEITDSEINKIDTDIIDEGQFFNDLLEIVTKWINNFQINIIVAGLDGDFQQKPIGQILNLIPLSNKCIKLNSVCNICKDGTEAPFSHRCIKSDETILIGGINSYIPVCRKHYNELNIKI
jgi:thymidine kinase